MFLPRPLFDSVTTRQVVRWCTSFHPVVPIRPLLWSSSLSGLGHILPLLSFRSTIHLLLYNALFNYLPLVLIKRLSLLAPLPLRQMLYLVCRCPFLPPSLYLFTFLSSSLIPCIIDLTSLCMTGLQSPQTPLPEWHFSASSLAPWKWYTSLWDSNRTASSGALAALQVMIFFLSNLPCRRQILTDINSPIIKCKISHASEQLSFISKRIFNI